MTLTTSRSRPDTSTGSSAGAFPAPARPRRTATTYSARWQIPARRDRVGGCRRVMTRELELWGVSDDLICVMELLVSELFTNSVCHTDTPAVGLALYLTDGRVACEVTDTSTTLPRRRPARTPGAADDDVLAESGRGLDLVDRLADRWGSRRHGDSGKSVWFSLRLPAGEVR